MNGPGPRPRRLPRGGRPAVGGQRGVADVLDDGRAQEARAGTKPVAGCRWRWAYGSAARATGRSVAAVRRGGAWIRDASEYGGGGIALEAAGP
jgi:hypothetical protein